MAFYLKWIGRFFAAFSIFSLSHAIWKFGISTVFIPFQKFWSAYVTKSIIFIFSLINVDVSPFWADVFIIYIFFAAALFRATLARGVPENLRDKAGVGIFNLIWPLTVIIFLHVIISALIKYGDQALFGRYPNPPAALFFVILNDFIVEILLTLISFTILFSINYAYL